MLPQVSALHHVHVGRRESVGKTQRGLQHSFRRETQALNLITAALGVSAGFSSSSKWQCWQDEWATEAAIWQHQLGRVNAGNQPESPRATGQVLHWSLPLARALHCCHVGRRESIDKTLQGLQLIIGRETQALNLIAAALGVSEASLSLSQWPCLQDESQCSE